MVDPDDMTEIKADLEKHGYSPIENIGHGAFGCCFLVSSMKYKNVLFVSKCIKICNEKSRPTYTAELSVLKRLDHPNIIKMYDYFDESNYLYIILEYCKNGTLSNIINKYGCLPTKIACNYVVQMIECLSYIHSKGVAHHDIKPSNIFIDEYGRIKFADFGLAMISESDHSTFFHRNAFYLPKEVLMKQEYDPFKADIWSLGVTVYKMMTGKLPFKGESVREIIALQMGGIGFRSNSNFLDQVVHSCLEVDSRIRPSINDLKVIQKSYKSLQIAQNHESSLPRLRPKLSYSKQQRAYPISNSGLLHHGRRGSIVFKL